MAPKSKTSSALPVVAERQARPQDAGMRHHTNTHVVQVTLDHMNCTMLARPDKVVKCGAGRLVICDEKANNPNMVIEESALTTLSKGGVCHFESALPKLSKGMDTSRSGRPGKRLAHPIFHLTQIQM